MGSRFVNGAKFAVSTTLGAAVAITALTNANPAVASTASPPAAGDIVRLKSGWTELDQTVARAAGVVAGTSFQLEEVNTTDLVRFPAGEGIGAFNIVGGFVSITQVRDFKTNGGDQNYFNFRYIEDQSKRQRQKPTYKSAMSIELVMDYDPDLAWFDTLMELDRLGTEVVLRETLPDGEVIYYTGTLSFNGVPSATPDENMTVTATFSLAADPKRYS